MPRTLWAKKLYKWYKGKKTSKVSPLRKIKKQHQTIMPMKIKRSITTEYMTRSNGNNLEGFIRKPRIHNLSVYVN